MSDTKPSAKLLAPHVLDECLRLVGGPSPTCGGLPRTEEAIRAHIASLTEIVMRLAAPVSVLSRAPEVAPELRTELLEAEQRILRLATGDKS
jgi:hypothetical protein